MDLVPGQQVDRYHVDSRLGEGGMAVVYAVHHTRLDTRHALKVLTLTSSKIRERLLDEGRIQASVRHPNIVAVSDVLDVQGAPALLMELVDGPTLDDLIRSTGALPLPTVDALARGILAGVDAAHGRGLVHRDLKPANVLLARGPEGLIPKVSDFGLARLLDDASGKTRTGTTMGTPQYMAPEQVRDAKSVGPESDVFALGAIFYEMLTGRRAFDGEDLVSIFQASMTSSWSPVEQLRPDVPPRMLRAIAGALEPNRERRIPTVSSLMALWVGDATSVPVADSGIVRHVEALAAARTKAAPTSADMLSEGPDASLPPPRSPASAAPSTVLWLGVGSGIVAGAMVAAALLAVGGLALWWSTRAPPGAVEQASAAGAPVPAASPGASVEAPAPAVAAPAAVSAPTWPAPTAPAAVAEVASDEPVDVSPPAEPATADATPEEPPPPEAPVPTPADAPADAPAVPPAPATDPRAALPPALRSSVEPVRMSHLLLLAADPSSAGTLATVARTDPSDNVRARAIRTLLEHWKRGLGPSDVQEDLAGWTARTSSSTRLRIEALTVIARRGTRVDDAAAVLTHPDVAVRSAAVSAVRDVGLRGQAAEARAVLATAATSESNPVVVEAIRSAGVALEGR